MESKYKCCATEAWQNGTWHERKRTFFDALWKHTFIFTSNTIPKPKSTKKRSWQLNNGQTEANRQSFSIWSLFMNSKRLRIPIHFHCCFALLVWCIFKQLSSAQFDGRCQLFYVMHLIISRGCRVCFDYLFTTDKRVLYPICSLIIKHHHRL